MTMRKMPTRGERNNNPTNIKRSIVKWLGEEQNETDPVFCQFVSSVYGIRAAFVNLKTHIKRLGKRATVKNLIYIWAPPNENDSAAYLKNVTIAALLNSDYVMTFSDHKILDLVRAIIIAENGRCIYSEDIIAHAWQCAANQTAPTPDNALL